MPRSDEAEWWINAVYAAVQEIPHGKVTSYGHIARLLGQRTWTRATHIHHLLFFFIYTRYSSVSVRYTARQFA